MKSKITLLIFAASLLGRASAQEISGTPALGATVASHTFEYRADSVVLDMLIDLTDLDLDSKESVVFTPIISNSDHSTQLPTVVVRGRNGAKSYRRAETVGSQREMEMYGALYKTPHTIVEYYGKQVEESTTDNRVSYSYAVPYEMWMATSNIEISSELYGCCSSDDAGNIPLADNALSINIPDVAPYSFTPQYELIKPAKMAVKRRDIKHSSYIIFSVNSSYINQDLADNRNEFKKIDDMMQSIITDEDCTITAVHMIGYASPEGEYYANQELSKRRATAIEQLLINKYDIDKELYTVEFGGENWSDLVTLVEESSLGNRDQIINIIDSVSVQNGREMQLMNLGSGNSYRYMLHNLFPLLRKVDIDVEFNVDAYDLARIKEVITTKPQNLSLEEMYRLSEGYDVDSEEFLNIFLTAVKVFPDNEIALHNAIVSELRVDAIEAATPYVEVLNGYSNLAPETANVLGAYYTLVGDYESAERYLQQSIDGGNSSATFNMDQMQIKRKTDATIAQNNKIRAKIYGN